MAAGFCPGTPPRFTFQFPSHVVCVVEREYRSNAGSIHRGKALPLEASMVNQPRGRACGVVATIHSNRTKLARTVPATPQLLLFTRVILILMGTPTPPTTFPTGSFVAVIRSAFLCRSHHSVPCGLNRRTLPLGADICGCRRLSTPTRWATSPVTGWFIFLDAFEIASLVGLRRGSWSPTVRAVDQVPTA
ncbi:unnamed protein product [Trypanosoma congolense IL3000]|uniref:WGS project CAEQ00000000 data, annotated contig 889 n=1 Tax=Trypanosoma congolense (strain IL3000) TaxID=1068625 RepID=F9WJ95_TRYCI|nr:unnamed protein product [Trypanosoma congolense IL3000]